MLAHRLLGGGSSSLSVSCLSLGSTLIAAAHARLWSSFRRRSESPLLLGDLTSSASVQWVFCRGSSTCRCISTVSVGRKVISASYSSAILPLLLSKYFYNNMTIWCYCSSHHAFYASDLSVIKIQNMYHFADN